MGEAVSEVAIEPRRNRHDDDELLALWHRHTSPQFAGLLNGDGWTFDASDPANLGYVSDSGVRLSHNELRGLALGFCAACEMDLRDNAAAYIAGDESLDDWHERAKQDCDDEILILMLLGAGGVGEATDEDYGIAAGRETTDEQPGSGMADAETRLLQFKEELATPVPPDVNPDVKQYGEAGSEKQVIGRAGSYAQSAYPIYENTRRNAAVRAAESLGLELQERSVLDPDPTVDHCTSTEFLDGCVELAEAMWQPLGSLAKVGERVCGPRCRCSFVWRIAPESERSPVAG